MANNGIPEPNVKLQPGRDVVGGARLTAAKNRVFLLNIVLICVSACNVAGSILATQEQKLWSSIAIGLGTVLTTGTALARSYDADIGAQMDSAEAIRKKAAKDEEALRGRDAEEVEL